jgi:hypothetical protein
MLSEICDELLVKVVLRESVLGFCPLTEDVAHPDGTVVQRPPAEDPADLPHHHFIVLHLGLRFSNRRKVPFR